jgi:hypothetical protein
MSVSKMEMFDKWLEELVFPGNVDDFVQPVRSFKDETQELKEVCIYTNQFKYQIFASDRPDDEGYLGCQVTARKMRAGEDWNRGNDLPDGDFKEETWRRILNAIINYELVILSKFTKPIVDTPEDIV